MAILRLSLLATVFLASGLGAASAQVAICSTSWINASGGDWTDPGNWDNGVPGLTDDACITLDGTYTVTVGAFDVNTLTLGDAANTGTQTLDKGNGGFSIVGGGTIEASGDMAWRNGYLTGGTLTNTGAVRLTAGGSARGVNALGAVFRNEGTVTWGDQQPFYVYSNGARVENAGLWESQNIADLLGFGGVTNGGGVFVNEAAGTLRKTTDATTNVLNITVTTFENEGTVDAQAGTIQFNNSSTHTNATLTAASGATVDVNSAFGLSGTITGAPDGTVEIGAPFTVSGAGATLSFSGAGLQWQTGYLTAGTLTNTGLVRLSGSGANRGVSADGAVFRNEGTVTWDDQQPFYVYSNGARVENAGLWESQNIADLLGFGGVTNGGGVFVNEAAGTLRKTTDATTNVLNITVTTFENEGTVDAQAGTIQFSSGSTHTDATLTAASGASVLFAGGLLEFEGTFTGSPAGDIIVQTPFSAPSGATWSYSGEGIQWRNGYLTAGTLTNTGAVRLTAGSSARGVNALGAVFRNEGTVTWDDQQPFYVYSNGARVENAGLWESQNVADLLGFGGVTNGGGVFVNEATGTLRKTTDGSTNALTITLTTFENEGTVDAQAGIIQFSGISIQTDATLSTAASATILFAVSSPTFVGTNAGTQDGTLALSIGYSAGAGAVWDFDGTGLEWRNGYLTAGTLTNTGLVRLSTGSTSRGVDALGAVFRNEGTVTWGDQQPFYVYSNGARVENAGLWESQNVADLLGFGGVTNGGGVFVNEAAGTLRKTGDGSTNALMVTVTTFENAGAVEILAGEVDVNGAFDHQTDAVVSGTGIFDLTNSTPFTFDGDVAPGASPGILTWQTAYAPEATSTLKIELGGTTPGTEHDQLVASGAVTLQGTLELDVTAGLSLGDTFTILTGTSVAGTFSDIVASGLPGYAFGVTYNATDVVVEVTSVSTPLTLNGRAGWRTLTTPFVNLPLGGRPDHPGLLEPIYTAGYLHADLDQRNRRGRANVFFYDEPTGAFVVPEDDGPIASGVGIWVYAFIDDDPRTPGVQGAFPKQLTATCAGCVEEPLPFTFPITYTPTAPSGPNDPGPGMNLVGNPAATDLDWDDPAWTRTNVSDVLYIYDPRFDDGDPGYSGGWRTWNGTTGTLPTGGRIPVGQGFHIEATGPDPVLTAPASAKLLTQSPLYRLQGDVPAPVQQSAKTAVPQIRLTASGEIDGRQRRADAFVTFESEAALGFDRRDARALAGRPGADALRLYTYLGAAHADESGSAFQISVLPTAMFESDAPFEIEVGAEALAGGTPADAPLALGWEVAHLPEGWSVDLVDRETDQRWSLGEAGQADVTVRAATALTASELDAGPSDDEVEQAVAEAIARGEEPPTAPAPVARALRVPLAPGGGSAKAGADRFVLVFSPEADAPIAPTATVIGFPSPNPTRAGASLKMLLADETALRVVVYDVLGRQVAVAHDGVLASGAHTVALDTGRLAPGAYVIRVQGGAWTETRRLTITR